MEISRERFLELLSMDPYHVLDEYVNAVQSGNVKLAEELREFITDRMIQANFC